MWELTPEIVYCDLFCCNLISAFCWFLKIYYVRKFNPALYPKHKLVSGCAERNALLGLLVNHIRLIAPACIKKIP
jgi:hypothetical protein